MSAPDYDNEGGYDDEEEDEKGLRSLTDNIIFLVDARAPMYESNAHGVSHVMDVLSMVCLPSPTASSILPFCLPFFA